MPLVISPFFAGNLEKFLSFRRCPDEFPTANGTIQIFSSRGTSLYLQIEFSSIGETGLKPRPPNLFIVDSSLSGRISISKYYQQTSSLQDDSNETDLTHFGKAFVEKTSLMVVF
ncbi:UNVERIFIED_CONTAM: hypothetical protein Slati_4024500 [Sesamum latifolium]|uniref:Uncharacterized protein n=1 Tax=Sesamum latifolium TaxID=2727402 RepID=A0AAW2TQB5_9LAMI